MEKPQIEEAGRQAPNFWQGKTPCWQMCHCPESIKNGCPAFRYQHLPCWEIEGTYLKLSDDGSKGDDTSLCRICRVYERYGRKRPIELKLHGKGVDSFCRTLQQMYGGGYLTNQRMDSFPHDFCGDGERKGLWRQEVINGRKPREEGAMAGNTENIQQGTVAVVSGWAKIKRRVKRLTKALSQVVSIDEDAIFKSKDWPHLWKK